MVKLWGFFEGGIGIKIRRKFRVSKAYVFCLRKRGCRIQMHTQSTPAGLFPLLKYDQSRRYHAESERTALPRGQIMVIAF